MSLFCLAQHEISHIDMTTISATFNLQAKVLLNVTLIHLSCEASVLHRQVR